MAPKQLPDGRVAVLLSAHAEELIGPDARAIADYLEQAVAMKRNAHITHHHLRFNSRELRFYSYLQTGITLRRTLEQFGRTSEDVLTILQVIFVLHQTSLLGFGGAHAQGARA